MAVVLLIGASLALRSFVRLTQVNPGFDVDDQLTFTIVMPASRYTEASQIASFARAADERLAAVPGVAHAGATTHLPSLDQLDLSIKRTWRIGATSVEPRLDIYNVTNAGTILGRITSSDPPTAG